MLELGAGTESSWKDAGSGDHSCGVDGVAFNRLVHHPEGHFMSMVANIGLGRRRITGVAAVVMLLAAGAPVRADKESVRKVMDAMEKAVLAGDKDAYMVHVWKEDPCFLQEQKAWTWDFDRHRAAEFSLGVKDGEPETFGEDDAKFTILMSWSMGEDVPHGKNRKVSYPVVFKKKDGVWLYAGEDWKKVDAPGVDGSAGAVALYLDDAEHPAQTVVDVLPEVRAHVDEGFENKITRVQEVKLYKSMRHLQASIYLSYTDGLGGWNEPGEAIKVLADGCRTKGMARPLLAHEYGHCATFEYGPETSKMAWWVLEGVAELSAEGFSRGRASVENRVKRWARRGELAPWEEMADFHNCPDKWQGHVYTQGHHMVGYVSDTWGREGRNKWIKLMAQGKTLDEASKEALGLSFADLDKKWRAALPGVETADDAAEPKDAPEKKKDG